MDNYFRARRMVDADIEKIKATMHAYSHDGEIMETLFNHLMQRYANIIDGFTEDMALLLPGESNTVRAETCRRNITLLEKRLSAFRDNDYQNAAPQEDVVTGRKITMAFNAARIQVGRMEGLSEREKSELMEKLEEMEDICSEFTDSNVKYNRLRPYLIWISGKSPEIGFLCLSLILLIAPKQGEQYD